MKHTKLLAVLAALTLVFGFVSCKTETDDDPTEYTITLYTEFGGNATIVKVESGKTLGANMPPEKEGYDFKGWFGADGTDYTKRVITGDVTLFAYFVKSTTTTTKDGSTTTTNTTEIGADSYESEKTVSETVKTDGKKVTVTIESTTRTNADGSKTETESTETKTSDGTNTTVTSETTVTTKDSSGKTTSIVETVVSADGTTTTKTTDAKGNTTTETTGRTEPSSEKLPVTLSAAGLPTFEIAIPKGTIIVKVYRKKIWGE